MTAAAFVRKRPIYAPGPQVALDYLFEKRRTRKRGFVAMTVAELGRALGRCESTIQRWLNALTNAGEVLRIYNGGQGRRRACVFYVGKSAVDRAREAFPPWDAKNPKREDKPAFPPLRMGKVVLDQRSKKGRKNATLNLSASVESRGGVPSELPPLGDQPRAAHVVADSTRPPSGPPSGGAASEEPAPESSSTPAAPALTLVNGTAPTALERPRPNVPPDPQGGETKAVKKRVRPEPAWLELERRTLVCQAWGDWRKRYRRARGRDYLEHPGDGRVMQRLIARALVKAGRDPVAARELLRWWFGQYMADPNPPTSPLGEQHHPLFRLERITEEYGSPRLERVSNRDFERFPLANTDAPGVNRRPKPNDPGGTAIDRQIQRSSAQSDGEMGDRHRRVKVRRHAVGQGNELAEARKVLAWLESLAESHPNRRVQLDRQRAYVRRLELEHEGKEP